MADVWADRRGVIRKAYRDACQQHGRKVSLAGVERQEDWVSLPGRVGYDLARWREVELDGAHRDALAAAAKLARAQKRVERAAERTAKAQKAVADGVIAECQVCGRAIGFTRGVIAHHGYRRPGTGWQTSSCFGARAQAYEFAHDRLDAAIVHVTDAVKSAQARVDSLAVAPATITYDRKTGTGKQTVEVVVEKPADFDESNIDQYEWVADYRDTTYRQALRSRRAQAAGVLRGYKADLAFLVARRKAWKAPEPSAPLARIGS